AYRRRRRRARRGRDASHHHAAAAPRDRRRRAQIILPGGDPAMPLLDGKVAIITGASKGIGRALSLCFARENAAVVCAARSEDLVRETADMVKKAGGRAIHVTCDAAREEDVKRMVADAVKAFGKITTLVNNAGDGGPT